MSLIPEDNTVSPKKSLSIRTSFSTIKGGFFENLLAALLFSNVTVAVWDELLAESVRAKEMRSFLTSNTREISSVLTALGIPLTLIVHMTGFFIVVFSVAMSVAGCPT